MGQDDRESPTSQTVTAKCLTEQANDCLAELVGIIRDLEGLLGAAPAAQQPPQRTGRAGVPTGAPLDREWAARSRLTARERQVMELLLQGLSNRRIARTLGISEPTVKNHMHAIFLKLDVSDRTQAIAKVFRDAH